jgi:hypothetical protein
MNRFAVLAIESLSRHIQAKSFDALALLGGSLLQPRQVHGLQSWCSVGDNVERAP